MATFLPFKTLYKVYILNLILNTSTIQILEKQKNTNSSHFFKEQRSLPKIHFQLTVECREFIAEQVVIFFKMFEISWAVLNVAIGITTACWKSRQSEISEKFETPIKGKNFK
mgnify:CR=1 FL=1